MAYGSKCPSCRTTIPLRNVDARGPFQCPVCSQLVHVPRSYHRNNAIAGFVIGTTIAYASDARWLLLVFWSVALYLLCTLLLGAALPKLFGLPLECVDEDAC